MLLELSLKQNSKDMSARDLSFLLHKHPDHLHERDLGWGKARVFYTQAEEKLTTAVLYLEIDPVGLVRGRADSKNSQGLLAQYVNDRPYSANSFLSVAVAKTFGQTLSGKSKERQELADQKLQLSARITPVAVTGGDELIKNIFAPLGYEVEAKSLNETTPNETTQSAGKQFFDLTLTGEVQLSHLLNHLYVLIPVMDNFKHYFVDQDEVENLMAKGEGWLGDHPARELIMRRALKYRSALANEALARLAELSDSDEIVETEAASTSNKAEQTLERPLSLHDIRLDTVTETIRELNARSVLDLGCGEGKLLKRLVKEKGLERILGIDASLTSLERAAEKLYLNKSGESLKKRLSLKQGSLTYGDHRWENFDVAVLVEVIEHIDLSRLPSLEQSLFGVARPGAAIITTPNREYNTLFETMNKNQLRHSDHRFEWTREEFRQWGDKTAGAYGYDVEYRPLGPVDEAHGAPSQMALFTRKGASS